MKSVGHIATARKTKFSIKDFFSKYDQIRKKLRIWSHLLKKSLAPRSLAIVLHRRGTNISGLP